MPVSTGQHRDQRSDEAVHHLTSHPDETEDAVVGLDAHGRYYLNRVPVSEAELTERLTERFRLRPEDHVVYLRADKDLTYSRVQVAMAVSATAGARVVGLVSEQPPAAARAHAR